MNIEELRTEIVSELDNCIEQIKREQLMFCPCFECALAQTELLSEELNSSTLSHLLMIIYGKLNEQVGSEFRVDSTFLTDIQQLRHIVANVVGK